jgi:hypothetical protein
MAAYYNLCGVCAVPWHNKVLDIKAYVMFPFFTMVGLYYANITACSMRLIYLFVLPILQSVAHATTYKNNP